MSAKTWDPSAFFEAHDEARINTPAARHADKQTVVSKAGPTGATVGHERVCSTPGCRRVFVSETQNKCGECRAAITRERRAS